MKILFHQYFQCSLIYIENKDDLVRFKIDGIEGGVFNNDRKDCNAFFKPIETNKHALKVGFYLIRVKENDFLVITG